MKDQRSYTTPPDLTRGVEIHDIVDSLDQQVSQ